MTVSLDGLRPLPPPARPAERDRVNAALPATDFATHLARAEGLPDWRGLIADAAAPSTRKTPPALNPAPENGPRLSYLARLEAKVDPSERRQMENTAREMEGLFLKLILKDLQKSMGRGQGIFGGEFQSGFYEELGMEQMGEALAQGKGGGIGVGQLIYESLLETTAGTLPTLPDVV